MTVTSPGSRNPTPVPKGSWPCLPGRLQFPSGLLSFSATFHYPWQSQGKHDGKAVVQLPHSPGILSGKLWDGFCAQCWDPALGSGVQRAQSQESGQSHTQGAHLGVRDKPGAGEATRTLRVCLSCPSWCPGHPHMLPTLWADPATVGCRAGLPHLCSLQGCPGAAPESPEPCVGSSAPAILLPSSPCPGSTAWTPANTSLHHSTSSSSFPFKQTTQTLQKHLWQKASSTGAGITSCLKHQGNPFYCNILDILTYFPLPSPTLHPLKHT